MRDEPADFTVEDVSALLRKHWGIAPATVTYAPVGFGSHHWIAGDPQGPRWFITADRLDQPGNWLGASAEAARQALATAAQTVRWLADRGYEFAVAGLPARDGDLLLDVRPGWTMQVFPYLTGWSTPDGYWEDPAELVRIAGLVGRLHAAEPPPYDLRRWDFEVPSRAALRAALAELDREWTAGPYAERARGLLVATQASIGARFARYDELVREVAASPDPWVVSHGEPHSANVIRTAGGGMRLIDWDTVALAPRERDLTGILDGSGDVLAAYQRAAGPVMPRPGALELFQLWWALAEISGYVALFRRPHGDTADSAESWRNLRHYAAGGS